MKKMNARHPAVAIAHAYRQGWRLPPAAAGTEAAIRQDERERIAGELLRNDADDSPLGRSRETTIRWLLDGARREDRPASREATAALDLRRGSGSWVQAKHRCVWCMQPMFVRLADRRQRCINDCASGLGACPEHLLPDQDA